MAVRDPLASRRMAVGWRCDGFPWPSLLLLGFGTQDRLLASYMVDPTRLPSRASMLYVDLGSFKSTVDVSNYRVWSYRSGMRPSATIGLGCVGSGLAGPCCDRRAVWNPDGSIALLGGVGGEDVLMRRFSMPIPSGVTFFWTGGVVIRPSIFFPVCVCCHLFRGSQGDGVLCCLRFDAMRSDARIGYCGVMCLGCRLQAGWECEDLWHLPLFRRVPVGVEAIGVGCG